MNIGYARISLKGPPIHSQVVLLERAGCEIIYTDHTFEVNENRLGLIKMLKNLTIKLITKM
jgi:DNA invertase Pin-like site-specific DNA recombinase